MSFEYRSSNLSPTALAHKLIGEIMNLADMLSPRQQRIIKEYCDQILQNRSAISDATNLLPLEAALMVIQVTERERNNHEISEIHKDFEALKHKLEELEKRLNGEI